MMALLLASTLTGGFTSLGTWVGVEFDRPGGVSRKGNVTPDRVYDAIETFKLNQQRQSPEVATPTAPTTIDQSPSLEDACTQAQSEAPVSTTAQACEKLGY